MTNIDLMLYWERQHKKAEAEGTVEKLHVFMYWEDNNYCPICYKKVAP